MDSIPTRPLDSVQTRPMPFSAGFHIDGAKQQLMAAINARNVTDENIGNGWIVIPIITYIAGMVAILIFFTGTVLDIIQEIIANPYYTTPTDEILARLNLIILIDIVWSILSYALFAILAYKLMNRHNEHSERESHLRMGILSFLRAAAGSPEKEAIISTEIATMNMLHSEASSEEPRRMPVLWALVIGFLWVPGLNFILMIVSAYMFYFLTKENWQHDRRFHDFMAQAYSALYKLGYSYAPVAGVKRLERRSFILYLVLSIITGGLFVLYWWYALVKDPNEHYRQQWHVEDHLANVIAQK